MISNTDSTLLIYSTEHIRVKAYTGPKGPDYGFSRRVGAMLEEAEKRIGGMASALKASAAKRRGVTVLPSVVDGPTSRTCGDHSGAIPSGRRDSRKLLGPITLRSGSRYA
jgi:hypothetical protein